jgi:hypothetical protein
MRPLQRYETIAHSEHTNAPACILPLDLQNAFDNIAHKYLFEVLKAYGFSDTFRHRLRCLYTKATSLMHINGHLSSPIQIQSSIRQGCLLSMVLFTVSINPLLHMLDDKLLQLVVESEPLVRPSLHMPTTSRSFYAIHQRSNRSVRYFKLIPRHPALG